MNWETEQYKCELSHVISTALLASLQALNLFWLFYILRIAYRFVFMSIVEDDRSDNDENELAEEMRLDALAKGGLDVVAAKKVLEETPQPKIKLNGNSINGRGTGVELKTDGVTNRKENVRLDS